MQPRLWPYAGTPQGLRQPTSNAPRRVHTPLLPAADTVDCVGIRSDGWPPFSPQPEDAIISCRFEGMVGWESWSTQIRALD